MAQVKQHYIFPLLQRRVIEVISQYNVCNKAKTVRYKLYRLLQPLLVLERL
jgi:hypothetical protein